MAEQIDQLDRHRMVDERDALGADSQHIGFFFARVITYGAAPLWYVLVQDGLAHARAVIGACVEVAALGERVEPVADDVLNADPETAEIVMRPGQGIEQRTVHSGKSTHGLAPQFRADVLGKDGEESVDGGRTAFDGEAARARTEQELFAEDSAPAGLSILGRIGYGAILNGEDATTACLDAPCESLVQNIFVEQEKLVRAQCLLQAAQGRQAPPILPYSLPPFVVRWPSQKEYVAKRCVRIATQCLKELVEIRVRTVVEYQHTAARADLRIGCQQMGQEDMIAGRGKEEVIGRGRISSRYEIIFHISILNALVEAPSTALDSAPLAELSLEARAPVAVLTGNIIEVALGTGTDECLIGRFDHFGQRARVG